jgi:hypothetical protein
MPHVQEVRKVFRKAQKGDQGMNYKIFAIAIFFVALLVIVPASAEGVWHNNKFFGTEDEYEDYIGGAAVEHSGKTGVDSKYRNTNPASAVAGSGEAFSCILRGNVRAGYNTLNREILISNNADNNTVWIPIPVKPDGTFEFNGLAIGHYKWKRVDIDPGMSEQGTISCNAGQQVTYPEQEILGHAVTGDPRTPPCNREVLKASYGAFEEQCTKTTEYRYWIFSHEHDCVPGIGPGCGMWAREIEIDTSHWSKWQTEEPEHCIYIQVREFGGHPKLCEQREVETCETVGGYADVTSNVRDALATGHLSFLFRNDVNPGGIFDIISSTLLSEIEDPAPGIVKHVSIDYKDCGGNEQHVSVEEYQQITLL